MAILVGLAAVVAGGLVGNVEEAQLAGLPGLRPEIGTVIPRGSSTVVRLPAGRSGIYRDNPGAPAWPADSDSGGWAYLGDCFAEPLEGGDVDLTPVGGSYNIYLTRGARTWQLSYEVEASREGRYRIECTSDRIAPFADFAVGDDPAVTRLFAHATRALYEEPFSALLCPAAVLTFVLIILVALRRAFYRRRLERAAATADPDAPAAPPCPLCLRPGRCAYLVAAVVAVAMVTVLGGCVRTDTYLVLEDVFRRGDPRLPQGFGADGQGTVRLTADRRWAVYSDDGPAAGEPGVVNFGVHCEATALDGGTIRLTPAGDAYDYWFHGVHRRWQLVYEVEVERDGRYRLDCRPTTADAPAHYAVGHDAPLARHVGRAQKRLSDAHLVPVHLGGVVLFGLLALMIGRSRADDRRRRLGAYSPSG